MPNFVSSGFCNGFSHLHVRPLHRLGNFLAPEAGGKASSRNPWPEMWVHATQRRRQAKDAVENALHQEVCAGTLTLQEAQDLIRTDWFKYYRDKVLK
jgi:hypothetical protein